jgi:nitroreductase
MRHPVFPEEKMKKMLLVALAAAFIAPNIFAAQTIDTIMNRKSVRSYERGKISQQDFDIILKAAMAAPSAMNVQPWAFVVVDDYKTLDLLASKLPYAKMLKEASAAIIVCGKSDDKNFWITDCSAATENILLAVEDLGLGAVWTAVYPDQEKIDSVKKLFSIPEEFTPLNVIPVGKPKGETKPKNKYDAGKIHINKW